MERLFSEDTGLQTFWTSLYCQRCNSKLNLVSRIANTLVVHCHIWLCDAYRVRRHVRLGSFLATPTLAFRPEEFAAVVAAAWGWNLFASKGFGMDGRRKNVDDGGSKPCFDC